MHTNLLSKPAPPVLPYSGQTGHQPQEPKPAGPVRYLLLILLFLLALVSLYMVYSQEKTYDLQVFQTTSGWGYTITSDGETLIYQATVPGLPGTKGFASNTQAQRVGELVVRKLYMGQLPPTVTTEELKSMGITQL